MPQLHFEFILFSALVVLVYWLIPSRWKVWLVAAASTAFLATLDMVSLAVLVALTACAFYVSRNQAAARAHLIVLAVVVFLFSGIRIAQLLTRYGQLQHYLVLVGFGFSALKLIHYVIDSRSEPFRAHSFLDFYNYMLFFPTLSIGPIHRFEDFLASERRLRWNAAEFASGLERILYGYGKVIILANWLVALKLDSLFSNTISNPSLTVIADSIIYGFYLYFAFSGYSDIAIGLGSLLGYKINENFNYPFLKRNIGEFWQSWHMSLSFWCRKYVFLPVFAGTRNLAIAMIGTMVAIGLWHEFSLRFVLWGVYHGVGLLIWRFFNQYVRPRFPAPGSRLLATLTAGISVAFTFLFVMVGFTIPRSESLQDMIRKFQQLAGL